MANETKAILKGSCACGRITFTTTSSPAEGSTICHCKPCQRLSGSAFQIFVAIPDKTTTWLDQKAHLKFEGLPITSMEGMKLLRISTIADRAMCADCGSCLGMRYLNFRYDTTWITAGCIDFDSLDQPILDALKPVEEIFVTQRLPGLHFAEYEHRELDRFPLGMEEQL